MSRGAGAKRAEIWTTLLETAIHAPSPHNVQPWRVRVNSDREADLFIDKERTLPKEDVTGSFIILTMGMFIEALGLLAAHRGMRLEHSLHHDPSRYTPEAIAATRETMLPFARLRLSPDGAAPPAYPGDLFLRRQTRSRRTPPMPWPGSRTSGTRDTRRSQTLRASRESWRGTPRRCSTISTRPTITTRSSPGSASPTARRAGTRTASTIAA